ncbi:hypothetical protein A2973_04635 [Candidatus Gottesmanbacteria bacterium RIFCSPLOWO2_01_FULL_49_10]|uniref:Uncharacterized protein n=1 Tax=Candidatus Gottesmanbacteria bacterium RIFCSPLOWO2_01_FULL_49_10 TaxID=1798396 RepID=A0A1F6AZQ9_9BACT|nr:MAG: hypothetical protein A2973_04635 [Candidatus Gottesmanbacteria bacterium RIFCSPLOWO2_01_FULL_49_10]
MSAQNQIEVTLAQLQEDIEKIKARNRRVEADKAWETSLSRTVFIATSTFILLYIFFRLNRSEQPFLNSFVSTVTYLLSTFSYGVLKRWWLKRQGEH